MCVIPVGWSGDPPRPLDPPHQPDLTQRDCVIVHKDVVQISVCGSASFILLSYAIVMLRCARPGPGRKQAVCNRCRLPSGPFGCVCARTFLTVLNGSVYKGPPKGNLRLPKTKFSGFFGSRVRVCVCVVRSGSSCDLDPP